MSRRSPTWGHDKPGNLGLLTCKSDHIKLLLILFRGSSMPFVSLPGEASEAWQDIVPATSSRHLSHRPPPSLQPDEFSKFSAGCNLCTSCSLIWLCDHNKILLCDQIKPLFPSKAHQALCDLPPPSAQNPPPLSLRVSNSCIESPCLGLSANMPNLK